MGASAGPGCSTWNQNESALPFWLVAANQNESALPKWLVLANQIESALLL